LFFLVPVTATTDTHTLSLHDALPIWLPGLRPGRRAVPGREGQGRRPEQSRAVRRRPGGSRRHRGGRRGGDRRGPRGRGGGGAGGRPGQGRAGGGREPGGVGEGAPRPRRGDPPAEGAHGLIAPEMSRATFRLTHPRRDLSRATPRPGSTGAEPNRRRPTSSPAASRYTSSSLTRSYSGIAGSVHRRAKYW